MLTPPSKLCRAETANITRLQCDAATASCSEEELVVADGSSLADDKSTCSPERIEVHICWPSIGIYYFLIFMHHSYSEADKFCTELDDRMRSYDAFIRNNPCLDPECVHPRTMDVLQSCFIEVMVEPVMNIQLQYYPSYNSSDYIRIRACSFDSLFMHTI